MKRQMVVVQILDSISPVQIEAPAINLKARHRGYLETTVTARNLPVSYLKTK